MKRIANNISIYYFISVLSHVILILAVILVLNFTNESVVIGNQAEKSIQSYLYKGQALQAGQASKKKSEPIHKITASKNEKMIIAKKEMNHAVSQKKNPVTPSAAIKAASQQAAAPGSNSKGAQVDELLAILHTAIQKQQHYPESALQMERQGRATMQFILFPNGSIQGLRVVQSSGTESLDHAAMAAVRDAAPFDNIDQYLNDSREFSIDVVFDLS